MSPGRTASSTRRSVPAGSETIRENIPSPLSGILVRQATFASGIAGPVFRTTISRWIQTPSEPCMPKAPSSLLTTVTGPSWADAAIGSRTIDGEQDTPGGKTQ